MMEFKIGDRVKILNTEFGNKDKIGTITNISGRSGISKRGGKSNGI